METGNKISDNNYSAGQVKNLPGDCCFKENGIFAVVPNELLTDSNAACFLPIESHLRQKADVRTVRIDDNISVVCEQGERHSIVGLLRMSLANERANLAIEICGERMYVVASARGKTIFVNCFVAKSDEDVLYYMLAVCEHVGFGVGETPVMAMSAVPELVRRYFEIKR